jgi:hypothetical protein
LIVFVKLKIFSLDTQVLTSFYCVFAKELIIYIGIFWFYNSALIAKKIAVKELTPDDIGMVDSPFEHINEWESRRIYLPDFKELASTEYQEFPRGRVVYSNVTRKATIYMDSSLFVKKYKRLLINYFDLADCSVTWKKDSHYQVFSY